MKEQFATLGKWHDEVFSVQRTHKKKFEETKELVHNVSIVWLNYGIFFANTACSLFSEFFS